MKSSRTKKMALMRNYAMFWCYLALFHTFVNLAITVAGFLVDDDYPPDSESVDLRQFVLELFNYFTFTVAYTTFKQVFLAEVFPYDTNNIIKSGLGLLAFGFVVRLFLLFPTSYFWAVIAVCFLSKIVTGRILSSSTTAEDYLD